VLLQQELSGWIVYNKEGVKSRMASFTLLDSNLDLRSSGFTTLGKGWGVSWLRLIALVLVDSTLLSLAWWLAESYRRELDSPYIIPGKPLSLLPILIAEIGLVAGERVFKVGKKRCDWFSAVRAVSLAHALLLLLVLLYQIDYLVAPSTLLLSWLLSVCLTCAGRLGVSAAIDGFREKGLWRLPSCVICDRKERETLAGFLERDTRYEILEFADSSCLERDKRLATIQRLVGLGVAEVFVSAEAIKNRMFVCWMFRNAGINFSIIHTKFTRFYPTELELTAVGGLPAINWQAPLIKGADFCVKRGFDFCLSALLLALAFPVYLIIALLIKLDSHGPVFYKQTRIGLRGKPFQMWKFRTMVANAEQLQKQLESRNETKDGILFKIKDDPRITRAGKFLRRYSLDELPQIFNVLLGEMSLVGPRPLPVRDVERFAEHHHDRQEVLPGITGFWQVTGRSEIQDFEEVVRLDMAYIENWSLALDLQILVRTVIVVLNKRGAY
jgi:exopolysaccharide biosynthesis polyprenyl glycosylphosphotransferase